MGFALYLRRCAVKTLVGEDEDQAGGRPVRLYVPSPLSVPLVRAYNWRVGPTRLSSSPPRASGRRRTGFCRSPPRAYKRLRPPTEHGTGVPCATGSLQLVKLWEWRVQEFYISGVVECEFL